MPRLHGLTTKFLQLGALRPVYITSVMSYKSLNDEKNAYVGCCQILITIDECLHYTMNHLTHGKYHQVITLEQSTGTSDI